MSNQSISCPSCGAVDCREYRADAFVCSHCDTTFRWVDPSRMTVRNQPASCLCGRQPCGSCTQCNAPICRDHKQTWGAMLNRWQSLKKAYAADRPDLFAYVRTPGGLAHSNVARIQGWLLATGMDNEVNRRVRADLYTIGGLHDEIIVMLQKHLGSAIGDPTHFLCPHCVESLFVTLVHPVEDCLQRWVANGQICSVCVTDFTPRTANDSMAYYSLYKAHGECEVCHASLCAAHGSYCTKCDRWWCKSHADLTEVNYSTRFCRKCIPRGIISRLFFPS
jgi:hypothetical protein